MSNSRRGRGLSRQHREPRLRLRTTVEVAEAIPFLFGYQPQESLVVLGLIDGRVGPSLRVDLDASQMVDLVGSVLDFLQHSAPERVFIAIFTESPERIEPDVEDLSDWLRSGFTSRGVAVQESLLVSQGRCRSLICSSSSCCPPEGWELVQRSELELTTMAAALGVPTPVRSRAELEQLLGPLSDERTEEVAVAIDDAAAAMERRLRRIKTPAGLSRLSTRQSADAVRRIEETIVGWADRTDLTVSDGFAAWLIVAVVDVQVRDAVLMTALEAEDLEPYERLWLQVTQRAIDEWAAAPATILGFIAWKRGSGTRARIAIERALCADPQYRLAAMLETALDHGLPPSAWGSGAEDLSA